MTQSILGQPATPRAKPTGRAAAFILMGLASLLLFGWLIAMVVVVPRFTAMFASSSAALPAVTVAILRLSHALRSMPVAAAVSLVSVGLPLVPLTCRPRAAIILAIVLLVLEAILIVATALGLFLPIASLAQSVQ